MRHLAFLLPLTACATTGAVLNTAPTETLASARSAAVIVSCIQARSRGTTAELQDDGSTRVLFKNQYGALATALDVAPAGQGSTIMVRKGQASGAAGKWRECL